MTAASIRVKGIEKSYKDLHVLRGGVDFEVAPAVSLPCWAPMERARPPW